MRDVPLLTDMRAVVDGDFPKLRVAWETGDDLAERHVDRIVQRQLSLQDGLLSECVHPALHHNGARQVVTDEAKLVFAIGTTELE